MGMQGMMAAIGGAQGGIKGFEEQDKERRDRQLAAETARYMPWTGLKPKDVEEASIHSRIAEGGASGLAAGKNFGKSGPQPQQQGSGGGFPGMDALSSFGGGESAGTGAGAGAAPSAGAGLGLSSPQAQPQAQQGGFSGWQGMSTGSGYDQSAALAEKNRRQGYVG
jgi:hypothetical protein